ADVGELHGLELKVSATTVRKILRQAGLGSAGERAGLSWHAFLRAEADSMLAVDFFTVETVSLQRLHMLFFLELAGRRVHLAGCTANPTGVWGTQQARQITWTVREKSTPPRFLIRDRDSKFTRDFDTVFAVRASRSSGHRCAESERDHGALRPHRSLNLAPPDLPARKL